MSNEIDYEALFGFDPKTIGIRYRDHWIIDGPDEWDEVECGVKSGMLCVKARDGASNRIDVEAFRKKNYFCTIQDDFDSTYRYYYFNPTEPSHD